MLTPNEKEVISLSREIAPRHKLEHSELANEVMVECLSEGSATSDLPKTVKRIAERLRKREYRHHARHKALHGFEECRSLQTNCKSKSLSSDPDLRAVAEKVVSNEFESVVLTILLGEHPCFRSVADLARTMSCSNGHVQRRAKKFKKKLQMALAPLFRKCNQSCI